MREWKKHYPNIQPTTYNPQLQTAFAYEIQESITDVLVEKTIRAAKQYSAKSILLSGGVASNSRLRQKFLSKPYPLNPASPAGRPIPFYVPSPNLCTDNAVMIAACAFYHNKPAPWKTISAIPDLSVDQNTFVSC